MSADSAAVVAGWWPRIPEGSRSTFRRHLAYALLNSAATGILANAPVMALKAMGSPSWQMALQMAISSIGMFLVLHLGGDMAERRKMPFMVVPSLMAAAMCFGMAVTSHVLVFLILSGLGALFENIASPAITGIVRTNYPPTHRGAATGVIRAWCSVAFLLTCVVSSWLLDRASDATLLMIRVQLAAAGVLSVAGTLVFCTIRSSAAGLPQERSAAPARPLREAVDIWRRDTRFRRYLLIGFLYSFGGMVFASFIPVLATRQLHCGYLASMLLIHGIPGVIAFCSTGWIGRWIDRTNPWRSWSWVRLGWGLDPLLLAATPLLMTVSPPLALAVASGARVIRGAVMGGSWILWWLLGVNHFAPVGGDTTRYQGMAMFANGFARLLGPIAGAFVLLTGRIEWVFVAGGTLVLLSALLSARELAREHGDPRYATVERFEAAPSSTQQ